MYPGTDNCNVWLVLELEVSKWLSKRILEIIKQTKKFRNPKSGVASIHRAGMDWFNENVQGTCDSDSTRLYLAIAKLNLTIKTKKLSIFWNFLALIFKAEILYLTPLSMLVHLLFKSSLPSKLIHSGWEGACSKKYFVLTNSQLQRIEN